MTTEPLATPAMRERIARLRAAVDAAPPPSSEPDEKPETRLDGEPAGTTGHPRPIGSTGVSGLNGRGGPA